MRRWNGKLAVVERATRRSRARAPRSLPRSPLSAVLRSAAIGALWIGALPVLAQNSFGEATRLATPPAASQASSPQAPSQQPGTARPSATNAAPGAAAAGGGSQIPPDGFRPSPGNSPQAQGGTTLDRLVELERRDYGIAPTSELHSGEMHGPTPASIPGGQVITTKGLIELLRGGQVPVLTLDVLGGSEMIQGAVYAVPAAQSGSFSDATQQQFAQFLSQATGGNKQFPIVLYCLSPECWMSYNASLRAINLGYTNVLWYRGGIEAWKQAGLPIQSSGVR